MAISAKDVNKLRQMTGAGMMDCKKALVEADGDFDKAIEILRKKGQKVLGKREDRETTEGMVFVKTSDDHKTAVLIAIGCETDFVAKNAEFQEMGNSILEVAYNEQPASVDELNALKVGDLTVQETITQMVGKIGEKLVILNYERMEGEAVVPYIHMGAKLGVLVSLEHVGGADAAAAGKDVGMQIAAMNPVAVNKDSVPAEIVEKELEIGREQAKAEGKPENILDKIAQGKLNKYFKDNTLLEQPFVKDSGMNVGKYLDGLNKGMTVKEFKRIAIG
ncbi:MAG TPA: elongation factor Ts [Cytophagales bacterium]|nr:elongation factor Ts [Cytophagales bacterium]HAA23341.1 elongation factor Ts [Cytophagales bacterium]HAP65011.1 elongation factor Ts [Cytophagales bacterium]